MAQREGAFKRFVHENEKDRDRFWRQIKTAGLLKDTAKSMSHSPLEYLRHVLVDRETVRDAVQKRIPTIRKQIMEILG